MSRILGIDPGSRITGFGVIEECSDGRSRYIASGSIQTGSKPFPQRLRTIFEGVRSVMEQYRPDEMVIEEVFMHNNAASALKLGQARGAAICAVLSETIEIYEYSPREIKQAVVGRGGAEKEQVRYMVKIVLGIDGDLQIDASDALGVALCRLHHRQTERRLAVASNGLVAGKRYPR